MTTLTTQHVTQPRLAARLERAMGIVLRTGREMLPITSQRTSFIRLAAGYERMARQRARAGDATGALFLMEHAEAIRRNAPRS